MPLPRKLMLFVVPTLLLVASFVWAQQTPPATANQSMESNQAGDTEQANNALTPEAENKLIREVRHELVMLPYYGVFDNLAYKVDGRTVTLEGQVVKPVTKSDAGNAVKHIEGVEKVVNNIEILPPSPMDDRIRQAVYRSIYSYGPLFKYGRMAVPPIHIIVKNGRITLEGVVDSEGDKNLAGMRANQVPGTFAVTNNLRVVPPTSNPKKSKGQNPS